MAVDALRISVTDKCNLDCSYCAPCGRDERIPRGEVLSYEEIAVLAPAFVRAGITKIRLTGGEPLWRRDLERLVAMLKAADGVSEVNLTTNGVLLHNKLPALARAGIDRINVSLNTLRRRCYAELTGKDAFDTVFAALGEVMAAGIFLKLNVILFQGINDDEAPAFAELTRARGMSVRFIEYFRTKGSVAIPLEKAVPNTTVKGIIEERFGTLEPVDIPGAGPAENFRIPGARGSIGFISTNTGDFCGTCRRLRLSADGRLFPCLFAAYSVDLKKMLRAGADEAAVTEAVRALVREKPRFSKHTATREFSMKSIGG